VHRETINKGHWASRPALRNDAAQVETATALRPWWSRNRRAMPSDAAAQVGSATTGLQSEDRKAEREQQRSGLQGCFRFFLRGSVSRQFV